MLPLVLLVTVLVLLGPLALRQPSSEQITVSFVGDIMLGRGVAPIASGDPGGLFQEVRWVLQSSDLAVGNLESPLTSRPHQSANPFRLEADPETARLLAGAGFGVLSLANNHIGDAGPGGVTDTVENLAAAGLSVVGAGADRQAAEAAQLLEIGGLRIAILAFDATGQGLAAGEDPGVAVWDEARARRSVELMSRRSDLLVVSLHGGVEYLPESDPLMFGLAAKLTSWGADIVWGHGSHVVQPVTVLPGSRPSLVATSLGNFIFDQRGPLTGVGAVLQVRADRSGLVAYRMGATSHFDLRVRWGGWTLPAGDAALVGGEWWSLIREVEVLANTAPAIESFQWGNVVAASVGKVTGDRPELVVSFRKPASSHPVRDGFPDVRWADAGGNTPHLGIYRLGDLTPVWVASMVPAPVIAVAACDGSVALAYSELDDPRVVATGAAVWRSYGLAAADRLPGPGTPACADLDGDGRTEPVVVDRRDSP